MAVWSESFIKEVYSAARFDGEYFLPEYIENEILLAKCQTEPITRNFKISDGNHMSVAKHFLPENENDGIAYYRGQDINSYFLESSKPYKIPYHIFNKPLMHRSHFQPGDVLLSIVGTIGNLSIVPETIDKATGSCKIAILRQKGNVNPYFLSIFLLTKYGQLQIKRNTRGAVQMGLILEDMVRIKVPTFNSSEQDEISILAKQSISKSKLSQSLYTQAQEMLERELGLDKLVFDRPLSYEARLSEVVGNNRWDADYYQVKYRQLDKILSTYSIKKIRQLSEPIETGIYSSIYSDSGRYYIRGTDIKNGYIGMDSMYRTNILIPKYKTVVVENDILVTRVGSIGVCGIVEHELSGSFFSDNLIRIRLLKSLASEISPLYLNLLLNTTVGQMQMVRYSRGSVQQRLNQSQLAEIPVPIIRKSIQDEIGKILLNSRVAKKESQLLLEQSKRRVEELIEQAVKK